MVSCVDCVDDGRSVTLLHQYRKAEKEGCARTCGATLKRSTLTVIVMVMVMVMGRRPVLVQVDRCLHTLHESFGYPVTFQEVIFFAVLRKCSICTTRGELQTYVSLIPPAHKGVRRVSFI